MRAIAGHTLRESLRRRVFVVVGVLSAVFLALYAWGASEAFDSVPDLGGRELLEARTFAGAVLLGLSMFATLFLGAVLAIFLTAGAVRGDAERSLLQPLVVRPPGRTQLLLARFAAAGGVAGAYALGMYALSVAITAAAGGWLPDHVVLPGLGLALGVVVIAALSLLGSVFLSVTANGIAAFMLLGAGLTAGLLGEIGEAVGSESLQTAARTAAWAVPFEALYQASLHALTSESSGLTGVVLRLGPFGGAQGAGPQLWLWTIVYVGLVLWMACAAFARRDL